MKQETKPNASKKAIFWMLFPVGLLVTSVTGWLTMVSVAVDDPGFAVEPDYYKKASSFDAQIAQRRENERLGYHARVESFNLRADGTVRLVVHLMDESGAPLVGRKATADAFFNARAADVQQVTFEEKVAGTYTATLAHGRPGLWEVRLSVHGEATYTETLRPELSGTSGEAPDT